MIFILAVSITLQFTAALMAVRLNRLTGKQAAWCLIAIAIILMTIRRCVTLFRLLSGDVSMPPDLIAESIALVISILFVVGVARIAPIFSAIKSSGEALRKSENMYRTLAEGSHDAIFIINGEDKVEYVNVFGAGLFGLRPEDVIGKQRETLFPQEISGTQKDKLQEVFKAGELLCSETEIPFPKGNIWLNNLLVPLKDEQGKVVSVMGISRDVTDRKKGEDELKKTNDRLKQTVDDLTHKEKELLHMNESLREAELKFHSFASTAADAIILADQFGTITFWNNGARNIFGYEEDEAVGKPITILMPERYKEAHSKGIERVRANGKSQYLGRIMEFEGLKNNGSEFPVELSVTVWPTKDGLSFMGILRDVTERKQIEDKLSKSEYELRSIIDTEPDCIKLLAPDCTLLEMNPAGLAMIEADSLKSVIGKTLLSVIAPDYRRPFQKLTEKVFKGDSGVLEFELIGLKGTRRWLETHALPLRDAKGEITALLGITRDVTERKKADMDIKERVSELEKFYEMAIGRELKMKELKEEIARLKAELSEYRR